MGRFTRGLEFGHGGMVAGYRRICRGGEKDAIVVCQSSFVDCDGFSESDYGQRRYLLSSTESAIAEFSSIGAMTRTECAARSLRQKQGNIVPAVRAIVED